MKPIALIAILFSLTGCSFMSADSDAAKAAKESSARTKKFHELNDKVTAAQLVLQDYLTGEVKKCDAMGQLHPPAKGMKMQLHFSQAGADLVCDAQADPAQQPKPQATAPPVPSAPKP